MKPNSPRIILFTGDGKGKTTAALGMVLRASGHGLRCLFVQFIKAAGETGELSACRHLPGVEILQAGLGFIPDETNPAFAGRIDRRLRRDSKKRRRPLLLATMTW